MKVGTLTGIQCASQNLKTNKTPSVGQILAELWKDDGSCIAGGKRDGRKKGKSDEWLEGVVDPIRKKRTSTNLKTTEGSGLYTRLASCLQRTWS